MKFRKIPRDFEKLEMENHVIAHIFGMAIVRDDSGDLFYIECDEELCDIGEKIDKDALIPLDNLSPRLQRKIRTYLEENRV